MSGPIIMKVKIDIDCTPQEARTFFGLPRLEPMQDAVLGKIQERLTDYLDTRDGEALLKLWFRRPPEFRADAGGALEAVHGRPRPPRPPATSAEPR